MDTRRAAAVTPQERAWAPEVMVSATTMTMSPRAWIRQTRRPCPCLMLLIDAAFWRPLCRRTLPAPPLPPLPRARCWPKMSVVDWTRKGTVKAPRRRPWAPPPAAALAPDLPPPCRRLLPFPIRRGWEPCLRSLRGEINFRFYSIFLSLYFVRQLQ